MTDREGGKKMNRLDLIIDALEKANDGGNVLTSMRKHSPQPVNCGSWLRHYWQFVNTDLCHQQIIKLMQKINLKKRYGY